MAAVLSLRLVDAAAGNVITIPGMGLTGGGPAGAVLADQGVTDPPGLVSHTTVIPTVFAADGTSVQLGPMPDGMNSGVITVTASDSSTAPLSMRATSQYAQATEYIGEGMDISRLATTTTQGVSELDVILRRASSYVDGIIGSSSVRLLQVLEQPKYTAPVQSMAPRVYPWRTRGRLCPIVSVDQLLFVSAKQLVTSFNINDLYVNDDLNYIEILAYAIGNYALLGALQTIGYSANVYHLTFTSGYRYTDFPNNLRDATLIIATAMLKQRNLAAMGMGDVKKFEDKGSFNTEFVVPAEARRLLQPYIQRAFA